jgi:hypothetical protein
MSESTQKQSVAERVGELSDEVLQSVDAGRQAAIDAVRHFVSRLEEESAQGDPSRRKRAIEAALNLADELSAAQIELLHSIVRTATNAVSGKSGATKQ